jgi:fused signal recognition particle receptor
VRVRSLWRSGVMAASASVLATCVVVAVANPAFAHTATASVTETCVNEASRSTVQFSNNFAIGATLTYAGPASGRLPLAAMVGTTPGTNAVTVTVLSPGSLTYTVLWDDGVTQGARSVPLQPITDCRTAVTTTTVISAPPSAPATTAAPPPTAPAVTDTPMPVPAPTVLAATPLVQSPPPARSSPSTVASALPATGSDPAVMIAVAAGLTIAGAVLVACRRRWHQA